MISSAQGYLLGQFAGDALGSLVEFQSPDEIRRRYPDGVRELADGGTWHTIAGQPTDDSEMALLLVRMLVKTGSYDPEAARKQYQYWLGSDLFHADAAWEQEFDGKATGSVNHLALAKPSLEGSSGGIGTASNAISTGISA